MQELDEYIDAVKELPPAPAILTELCKMLKDPEVSVDDVVRVITYDPALTVRVVQMCNSAYFATGMPAANLGEAVGRLGFQQVYQAVTAVIASQSLAQRQRGYGIDRCELWKHSVVVALAAQLIAQRHGLDPTVAFTAGLLHDIGKVVLSEALQQAYDRFVDDMEWRQAPVLEAERRLLGVQHAEVGGHLLARWRFPASTVAAVWYHHQPRGAEPHQALASCVYLADMIAHFLGFAPGYQPFAMRGRSDALDILGLDPSALPEIMIQTFDEFHRVQALLHFAS